MNSAGVFPNPGVHGGGGAGRIPGRASVARWVAVGIAAGSIAPMAGALALAYADRHLLPAGLTGWDFNDVSGNVVNLAVPVLGLVLAYKRPGNRIGWLFLAAGRVAAWP
jgi:hypothetical protein